MSTALRKLIFAASLALAPASLIGCGPGTPEAKLAKMQAGPMPATASWDGVYYSTVKGTLHLKAERNLVHGRWETPVKTEWGKLDGNADGNLLRFDWTEFNNGLVGPNSQKSGKGYFVYSHPAGDNVDDMIKGEVGRDIDEVGSEWIAIKQRNVKPNLESIGGAGSHEIGGGEWDKGNVEKGEPEAPSEPTDKSK